MAALALRKPFRGRGLVRACMLIPYVAPVVAATFVWTTMLNPQFGIVNYYGTTPGLGRADRLPELVRTGVDLRLRHPRHHRTRERDLRGVAVLPVRLPVPDRAIQAIPETLEEAATVDGATPTQRFRHIILPSCCRPSPC